MLLAPLFIYVVKILNRVVLKIKQVKLLLYNNKDMIKETWKNLKPVNNESTKIALEEAIGECKEGDKPRGFDDLIDELPEQDSNRSLSPLNKTPERKNCTFTDS